MLHGFRSRKSLSQSGKLCQDFLGPVHPVTWQFISMQMFDIWQLDVRNDVMSIHPCCLVFEMNDATLPIILVATTEIGLLAALLRPHSCGAAPAGRVQSSWIATDCSWPEDCLRAIRDSTCGGSARNQKLLPLILIHARSFFLRCLRGPCPRVQ